MPRYTLYAFRAPFDRRHSRRRRVWASIWLIGRPKMSVNTTCARHLRELSSNNAPYARRRTTPNAATFAFFLLFTLAHPASRQQLKKLHEKLLSRASYFITCAQFLLPPPPHTQHKLACLRAFADGLVHKHIYTYGTRSSVHCNAQYERVHVDKWLFRSVCSCTSGESRAYTQTRSSPLLF